jgi:hypothetical protein
MSQSLSDALSNFKLVSDEEQYVIVHLPPNGITIAAAVIAEISMPFSVLLADKDEVTLILSADDYEEYKHRLRDHRAGEILYKLISFDIVLEHTLVGFLSEISRILASVNIPVMAFSGFERDHILVPVHHYELALHSLNAVRSR